MASTHEQKTQSDERICPEENVPPPHHAARSSSDVLLTVIIPVFNERDTIEQVLERVATAEPVSKQMIVVDDGSTDGTCDILERWRQRATVEVHFHERNRGKGAAIRTGLQYAIGDYTLIQDADLEYDPTDYVRMLQPLLDGGTQIVFGSRYLGSVEAEEVESVQRNDRPVLHPFRVAVMLLNLLVRILYGVRLTDEATCYKLFRTSVLRSFDLKCERFEFCPEVTAKACRLGLQIVEVPIRYTPRSGKEGKKIGLVDAIEAAWTLLRYRYWTGPTWFTVACPELSPTIKTTKRGN